MERLLKEASGARSTKIHFLVVFHRMQSNRGESNQRIAFIQPAYSRNRRPLFDRLRSCYDTTFYFMSEPMQHLHDGGFAGSMRTLGADVDGQGKDSWGMLAKELIAKPLALFGLLMREDYSVIVSSIPRSPQTMISVIVSRLKRSRVVLWIEDWFIPDRRPFMIRVHLLVARCVLRCVHAIVVHGTAQYQYVRSFGVPSRMVFVANHCSLDYSQIRSRDLRSELNLGGKLVVLFVGRIVRVKGLDLLIEAFCRIEQERDDVALLICGDGTFRPSCQNLANRLNARNVYFLGTVAEEEKMASYYKTADVVVLPTRYEPDPGRGQNRGPEGWGLVINEAMSMGKPILTTDRVGAAPDLVKDGVNGFVVRSGDVEGLYSGLKSLLESARLREAMGKNSRRIFEEFNDFDRMFEGFRKAIEYARNESHDAS